MHSARCEVQAKLPPDTPQEQRNVMRQALLAERFGLKAHKESKEVPAYSLVVGKNGPKLKKAEDTLADARPNIAMPPLPPGGRGPGPGGPGRMRMMMQPGGKMHLNATGMALSNCAEL